MRLLIVDDDELRHELIALKWPDAERHHVYTVPQARMKLLEDGPFDLALLDHDLGKGEPTGTDLSYQMAELPKELHPKEIVVHSWNPPAAQDMVRRLREAGMRATYIPFGG